MSIKKIKSKYKDKFGNIKIYEYEYDASKYKYGKTGSTRGKVLVNSKGVVNTKNVAKYKAQIMSSSELTDVQKDTLVNTVDSWVFDRKRRKTKLTTTGFEGIIADDSRTRMFANAGWSIDDAADELGISVADLLDEDNWTKDEFTFEDSAGKKITKKFKFNYRGNIWE